VIQGSVPQWEKFLNANGYFMVVWCLPSAVCASHIHWSQKKVLASQCFLPYSLNFLLHFNYSWLQCNCRVGNTCRDGKKNWYNRLCRMVCVWRDINLNHIS
jgi:hypothetical protein